MNETDVAVIGCGVMGAATARALAMQGRDVTIFERFRIGHARGSSHGTARIYRHSYTDPRYARMMHEALPLWRALEEERGEALLTHTGAVNIGEDLQPVAAAIETSGAQAERITPAEARARFGVVATGEAVLDPGAGVVRADAAWRALAASAVRHGAHLREGARVTSIEQTPGGARVILGAETIACRVAVVTAGPYARRLLSTAGIDLTVAERRETVAYFRLRAPAPVVLHWRDPLVYALPAPEGLIKVGLHITGPEADPETDGEPHTETVARASEWIAAHLPAADPVPVARETCFYTMAPDESFVLQRHGGVVVGSPCSGHGFKFAPLIGARLAALAT